MKSEILAPLTTIDALNKHLETPALDPVLLAVANDFLAGKSIDDIAYEFNISTDRVTAIVEKREVKAYIDNVYLSQGYLNRGKRLDLINKVIEQKVTDAIESGVYSKKDLLEWLKLLNDLETSIRPKESGPRVAVQINNNYDKLMKDLLD